MNLGIVQGRLLKPVEGNIQEFPKNEWEKEFGIIGELGLTHIEWIITNKSFYEGVIDLKISDYKDKISSITCDNLITSDIFKSSFLEKQLKPICDWALKNGVNKISIPLLEDSTITPQNKRKFFDIIISYGLLYPELEFHFEMESDWGISLELVKSSPNFYLIYDTGNITSCGFDHSEWIKNCIPYIRNVHLKDRTKKPIRTVKPFTGDTNFNLIFDKLKYFDYNGLYTLQLARGKDGEEIITTKEHIKLFKNLYEEKFI
tara:strand:+ start:492 stop:1271 length:780 start_codon:yes stop_codon:yes gene_type:complete